MQQSATLHPPTFVDLNVLPEELRPQRYPAWYVLGVVAILAVSLLMIPLYRVQQAGGAETARLQVELELIEEELTRIQIDFGRAREFLQELQTTEAAIVRLDEERKLVLGDGQELSIDLFAIVVALPSGAHLGSVTESGGQLTLTGQAVSVADSLEYARALVRTERFSEAQIASLVIASGQEGGGGVAFTLEVTR